MEERDYDSLLLKNQTMNSPRASGTINHLRHIAFPADLVCNASVPGPALHKHQTVILGHVPEYDSYGKLTPRA